MRRQTGCARARLSRGLLRLSGTEAAACLWLAAAAPPGASHQEGLLVASEQHTCGSSTERAARSSWQENADVWDWELSEADYAALGALGGGRQWRMVDGSFMLSPEGPYKTLAEFWDE